MRFEKVVVMLLASVLWISGCNSSRESADDPKGRLNEYISKSFAVNGTQDRKVLATYLTGDAKARIESWSDDQFHQAFIESKREFIKLAFKEQKSASADEVNITYEIMYQSRYLDQQGQPHDAKVTNRKLAQMRRENGKWFISDVRNIKELLEYKNELSL